MFRNDKVVVSFAAFVSLGLLLVGCSPTSQAPTSGGGEAVKSGERSVTAISALEETGERGGKLTSPATQVFGNPNDPHLVVTATGRMYAIPVTNGLLRRDFYTQKYPIVADLAENWEASKDGLSYTFKLRQGIKFHNVPPVNGREVTSADAKYSLMRILADPSIVPEKNRARFQRKLDFGSIKSIDTPDKYTLVVSLKEPYAPFLDSVAHPGTMILPREFVEKFESGFITEGMIGTGPYLPTGYKNQQIASYSRNPEYWKKDAKGVQLPYLDEVSWLYFADLQAELAAFRSRQLDVSASRADIKKGMIDSITKGDPKIKVLVTPKASINTFRFNLKFKPFQDVRVRRAVHLAIDRHQFLELIAEGRGVISGPVTPVFEEQANTMDWLLSQPGYRKDKKQDIEEAKRLLKEAGYADGLAINGMFSTGSEQADWASLLTDQLRAINVTLKAEQVDYAGQWVPRSVNGEFELSQMGHVYNVDVDSNLSAHVHTEGGRNYGKFSDPKLDDLINKQRAVVNPEERRKLAQEVEKLILETVPVAYLYATSQVVLVQPWAHNVVDGPVQGDIISIVERAWMEKH